jgi:hypothetical protein
MSCQKICAISRISSSVFWPQWFGTPKTITTAKWRKKVRKASMAAEAGENSGLSFTSVPNSSRCSGREHAPPGHLGAGLPDMPRLELDDVHADERPVAAAARDALTGGPSDILVAFREGVRP